MDDQEKLMLAMARLSRSPDFKVFLELYVQKELNEAINGCVNAPKPTLFQGTAQVLQKLVNDMDNAEVKYQAAYAGPVLVGGNPY